MKTAQVTQKPGPAPAGIKLDKQGRVAKSGLYSDGHGTTVFAHKGTRVEVLLERLNVARVHR